MNNVVGPFQLNDVVSTLAAHKQESCRKHHSRAACTQRLLGYSWEPSSA